MSYVIEFNNVYKRYRKNMKSFKSIFGYVFNIPSPDDFWALNNVSFKLKKGEILGIIGPNGAGKSTILKILANVTRPTKGDVRVNGTVGPLIEIGAGFHPELTGKENIYLYGSILGMSRKEIKEKFNDIVEFSGLKDFLNTPVKFYSSGMYLRLGFSVTVYTNPDILLVDEVLTVGDEEFQKKCLDKMSDFTKQNKTTIFISHNLSLVRNICKKILWLEEGKIESINQSSTVIALYKEYMSKKEDEVLKKKQILFNAGEKRTGTGEVRIIEVKMLNRKRKVKYLFETGDKMIIKMKIQFYKDIVNPIIGFSINDIEGNIIYRTNTRWKNIKLGRFKKNSIAYFQSDQRINFLGGKYSLTVAIHDKNWLTCYDRRENTLYFRIIQSTFSRGTTELYPLITITDK